MEVTILEPSGYCAGVERAMKMAIATKKKHKKRNVVVLGMLVHNEDAIKTLNKLKIKTIYKKDTPLEDLALLIKKPSIVILTAHGHSSRIETILKKQGHEIVDATCPFVSNSFTEIKKTLKEGKDVFYIGVKNHPESNAALSVSKKINFVDINNPIIEKKKYNSPLIISQTTLSENDVENIVALIKKIAPSATVANGICNSSTLRQESLKNIPPETEAIFIIGSRNSNNTRTLYKIAKKLYKKVFVRIIRNRKDIKEKDLIGLDNIVLCSGASTPKEEIIKIKNRLLY